MLPALVVRADNDRYSVDVNKDLTYRGGTISLDNSFGDIVVRPGNGNTVSLRATIRSSDPEFGKTISITTSETGGVSIKTEVPSVHMKNMNPSAKKLRHITT